MPPSSSESAALAAQIEAAERDRKFTGFGRALMLESPCDGCRHAERCKTGLACAALSLWVATGRISAVAPRQPNREIYRRLFR